MPYLQSTTATKVEYHFFESGHGKGPIDGLGGAIKRKLSMGLAAGALLRDAKSCAQFLEVGGVRVLTITPKDTQDEAKIVLPACHIKGTRDLQAVSFTAPDFLVKNLSADKEVRKVRYREYDPSGYTAPEADAGSPVDISLDNGNDKAGSSRMLDDHTAKAGSSRMPRMLDDDTGNAGSLMPPLLDDDNSGSALTWSLCDGGSRMIVD